MIDPTDPRFVVGGEEDRRRARQEYLAAQRVAIAMRSGLPEIPRGNLTFGRFGHIEDRSGEFYRRRRGEIEDPKHSSAVAFYLDPGGDPIYLERPVGGPRNHEELEQRRAENEQRRADQATRRPIRRTA